MPTMTITAFHENTRSRKYMTGPAYRALFEANKFQLITRYIENQVVQNRDHSGPRGLHFGAWRGGSNEKSNLRTNDALLLDYRRSQFEEVRAGIQRMGYAHIWIDTENKARTLNTISLVVPFREPVDAPTYERIASCFAKEIDTYGMIDGAITSTFITNIHGTSMVVPHEGELLDAEAYKRATKNLYQRQDAAKYYAEHRPACRATIPTDLIHPAPEGVVESGLFVW